MDKSRHQMTAAWIFGVLFIAFLMAVFWLADDKVAQWKQPIPAFFASLLAGLFGFFMTGAIKLVAEAKLSDGRKISLQAAGGAALFVVVFLGWSKLLPSPPPPPPTTQAVFNTTSQSASGGGQIANQGSTNMNGSGQSILVKTEGPNSPATVTVHNNGYSSKEMFDEILASRDAALKRSDHSEQEKESVALENKSLKQGFEDAIGLVEEAARLGDPDAQGVVEKLRKDHDTKQILAYFRKKSRDPVNEKRAALSRGLAAVADLRGDLDAAEKAYRQAIEIDEELGRPEETARDYENLGRVLKARADRNGAENAYRNEYENMSRAVQTRADLDGTEKMHRRALEIYEKIGSLEGMARGYEYLGRVLQTRGRILNTRADLDGAEKMYEKALELNKKLGQTETTARQYANLGFVLHTRHDLKGAAEMYRASLEAYEKLGRTDVGMAINYSNLGLIYKTRNDMEGAEKMYRKALELDERLGRLRDMANQYDNLGFVLKARDDFDGAEEMYQKALKIEEMLGEIKDSARHYDLLSTIYKQRGDKAKARDFRAKARELDPTIDAPTVVNNMRNLIGAFKTRPPTPSTQSSGQDQLPAHLIETIATHLAKRTQSMGSGEDKNNSLEKQVEAAIQSVTRAERDGDPAMKSLIDRFRKSDDPSRLQAFLEQLPGSTIRGGTDPERDTAKAAFLHGDIAAAERAWNRILAAHPEDWEAINQLGRIHHLRGELPEAESSYRRVLELTAQNEQWQATAYGNLGAVYQARGDLDGAEGMYRKALAIDEKLGKREEMATHYGNLGSLYQTRGDLDRAEEMYRKALAIDQDLGKLEELATHYGNLGALYQTRGDLDRAEEMHRMALAIDQKSGRLEHMASRYGNLGCIFQARGDLDHAEEMHRKALAIDEKLGALDGMATRYGNLGELYQKRGELGRAEEMLRKALAIHEKLGQLDRMAVRYGNLGELYQKRGDLDGAEKVYRKSLEINERLHRPEEIAAACDDLGGVLESRGDLDGAEKMYRKALEINEKLDRPKVVAINYANIGFVLRARGDLDTAERMHRKSLEISEKLGRPVDIAAACENLGGVLEARADFDGAEKMYRKCLEIDEKLDRPEVLAEDYGNLGLLFEKRGDNAKAREFGTKARDLATKNPQIWTTCVKLSLATSQPEEALNFADRAVEVGPSHPEAYAARGKAHLANHMTEAGIGDLTKAISLATPKSKEEGQYRFTRFAACISVGQFDVALGDLNELLERYPEDASIYFIRAIINHRLGRQELYRADRDRSDQLDREAGHVPVRLVVENVLPNSSAQLLDIRPGDTITEFNGHAISHVYELKFLTEFPGEGTRTVKILRDNAPLELSAPPGKLGVALLEKPIAVTQPSDY